MGFLRTTDFVSESYNLSVVLFFFLNIVYIGFKIYVFEVSSDRWVRKQWLIILSYHVMLLVFLDGVALKAVCLIICLFRNPPELLPLTGFTPQNGCYKYLQTYFHAKSMLYGIENLNVMQIFGALCSHWSIAFGFCYGIAQLYST